MQDFEIISRFVELRPPLLVELDEEQALRRAHAIKRLGDGLFEVVRPVQCRQGEAVGFPDGPPKYLANDLRPVSLAEESEALEESPAPPHPSSTGRSGKRRR